MNINKPVKCGIRDASKETNMRETVFTVHKPYNIYCKLYTKKGKQGNTLSAVLALNSENPF